MISLVFGRSLPHPRLLITLLTFVDYLVLLQVTVCWLGPRMLIMQLEDLDQWRTRWCWGTGLFKLKRMDSEMRMADSWVREHWIMSSTSTTSWLWTLFFTLMLISSNIQSSCLQLWQRIGSILSWLLRGWIPVNVFHLPITEQRGNCRTFSRAVHGPWQGRYGCYAFDIEKCRPRSENGTAGAMLFPESRHHTTPCGCGWRCSGPLMPVYPPTTPSGVVYRLVQFKKTDSHTQQTRSLAWWQAFVRCQTGVDLRHGKLQ